MADANIYIIIVVPYAHITIRVAIKHSRLHHIIINDFSAMAAAVTYVKSRPIISLLTSNLFKFLSRDILYIVSRAYLFSNIHAIYTRR